MHCQESPEQTSENRRVITLHLKTIARIGAVLLFVMLLSLLAVFNQVKAKGLAWQEEHYFPVLQSVVDHTAPWPQRGRTFSAYCTVFTAYCFENLGVPRPIGSAFAAIRILQNIAIFLLALLFYRRLGIPFYTGLLGVSVIAWGMTFCASEHFLEIDVYTELILLLCAALALCAQQPGWIIALIVLAIFNRETGLIFPLVWLAAFRKVLVRPLRLFPILCALLPVLIYLIIYKIWIVGLGGTFWQPEAAAAPWTNALGVLSIIPLLALAVRRGRIWVPRANTMMAGKFDSELEFGAAKKVLATLMLGILPFWLIIHGVQGTIFSTHALLVPQILLFVPGALLCLVRWNETTPRPRRGAVIAAVVGCALVLSFFTVLYQMQFMGLEWYETVQWERTQKVIHGESGTPWQYRLFTEGIVYGLVHFFNALGIDRPVGAAFVLVRFLQNTVAFSLAVWFYRKLGLNLVQGLWGIALLAYGMCHGLYDGDLTFNTYTDISIFLAAGLLILYNKPLGLIPLMLIAPFNRETSGCIPFMLLFAYWPGTKNLFSSSQNSSWRKILVISMICFGFWVMIVGGLRLVYGIRPYIVPTAGKSPIIPLLTFNLTWWRTWVFLFATLGLMPLLAIVSWRAWPIPLRRFFWAVVPVWFPIHFSLAHAPETRLFLVPQVLIFIPGALFGLTFWAARSRVSQEQGQTPP